MPLHPDDFLWPTGLLGAGSGHTAPLRIRWLGTAGYQLEAQGTVLLIDPYLSRVSLGEFLFRPLSVNHELLATEIPSATAVLVGHSHFDHVMDVPSIAARTGAVVYGSRSTANLMRASGLPTHQIVECAGGEEFEVGPFRVRMVPSVHSRFWLGRVPYPGEIPCSCELPLRGKHYRCGQVFGLSIQVEGVHLYHAGSADLIDDRIIESGVDICLLGISGRQATERYIPRVLSRLTPQVVVPSHYDNFFRGFGREMKLLPRTAFGQFVDDVHHFDRQIQIASLKVGQSVDLGTV